MNDPTFKVIPNKWNDMETAPRDGTLILLILKHHGVVEAHYSAGYWTDDTPNSPREYYGSAWICGDDFYQVEIEETPHGDFSEALGWLPRDVLPASPKDES